MLKCISVSTCSYGYLHGYTICKCLPSEASVFFLMAYTSDWSVCTILVIVLYLFFVLLPLPSPSSSSSSSPPPPPPPPPPPSPQWRAITTTATTTSTISYFFLFLSSWSPSSSLYLEYERIHTHVCRPNDTYTPIQSRPQNASLKYSSWCISASV